MSDVFISYAHSTAGEAQTIAEALRGLGYGVWRDDELPAHRPYADVIEERLKSAKAVLVLWSADAIKSEWVRAEADFARERHTLVQAALDGSAPPLPFNQIQCADLRDWRDRGHAGWTVVEASLAELVGPSDRRKPVAPAAAQSAPERIRIAVELRPIVMASGQDPRGLAHGLSGEIAQAMACLPGLRVSLGRGASGDQPDYVLDGSLQEAGERLRLTMSLLSNADRSLIWSEHYDGALSDLFGFQERAGTHIASNADTIVRTLEIEKAAGIPEGQLDLRQLYYRAIGGLRKMARQSLNDGARCAERVIELAPDHVHALAMAACIYLNIWMLGVGDGDGEGFRLKAGERASRALHLSDHDHWVTGLSAMVLAWVGHPIDVSVAQLDRICAMAPAFAPGWFWSGFTRTRAGDPITAIAHYERAIELESLTTQRSTMTGYLGAARVVAGDFAGALPLLVEALRVRSEWTSLHIFSAIALGHLGRIDEAGRELAISEAFAPVAASRWPTRDTAQRKLLCEGLARAGCVDAEQVFADV